MATWSQRRSLFSLALALGASGCFDATAPAAYCTSDASCPERSHCDLAQKKCAPGIVVTVTPSTTTIGPGATTTFSAAVSSFVGTPNGAVTWSVQEAYTAGTIQVLPNGSANFVSSGRPGTWHVVATTVITPSVTGTATVTVNPLLVTPSGATVNVGKTVQFAANGPGTWSVQEAAGGTITNGGLYTAPATAGTYHVAFTNSATSVTATVVVLPPVTLTLSPLTATAAAKGTAQFTATVTNAPPNLTGVQWTVLEAGGGTVNGTGLYTAPNAGGVFSVQAVSVADPLAAATARVTVSPPPSVQVSPTPISMQQGKSLQFAAAVTSAPGGNTAVAWSVQEAAGGTVDPNTGLYTAPAASGTFHVVATLKADATVAGSASVYVTASGPTAATSSITSAPTSGTTVHGDGQETFLVIAVVKDSTGAALPGAALVFAPVPGVAFTPTVDNPAAAWSQGALAGVSGSAFAGVADQSGRLTVNVSMVGVGPVSLVASTCFGLPCTPGGAGDLKVTLQFAGVAWAPATAGLSGVHALGITVDPKNASRLYLATYNGVFVSADKGVTWAPSGPGLEWSQVTPVQVGPGATPHLYTLGQTRRPGQQRSVLYVSTDGAASWTPRTFPVAIPAQLVWVDPLTPGAVYAAANGLYRSADDGLTWTAVIPPAQATYNYFRALAFDPAKAGTVFVIGYSFPNSVQTPFLFGASDGMTFSVIKAVAQGTTSFPGDTNPNALVSDVTGRLLLTSGQGALFASTDSGQTFSQLVASLPNRGLVQGTDKALYAFNDSGNVQRSTDGGSTWQPVLTAGAASGLSGVAADPADPSRLYASIDSSGFNSLTSGSGVIKAGAFTPSVTGLGPFVGTNSGLAIDQVQPTKVVLALNQTLYRSADGGASWVPVAPVPPGPSADLQSVAIDAAGLDGAGGGLWVVKNGALYRLAGGTGIWSTVNTSAAGVTFVPYLVRADPTLSGTAYVLTGDGQTVYRTPDGGSTWSSTGAIPFPAGQLPSYNLALKVLKQNGTTVLYYNYSNQTSGALLRWSSSNPAWALVHGETATTRSYNGYYPDATDVNTFYFDVQSQMFKSTDGFKTQTPLLFNTSGSYAYSFASDPRNPGTLWAGFFQPNGPGLAVSTDGGATWKRSDVGLGVSFPAQAEMYFAPGLILLNQRGHGLFRSTTNGLAP